MASPFLCGKNTLTPDLPLLQRLPVFRLPPQFFPVRAQVYVPLFIFRAVMDGLGHGKEVNAQFFQRPVCQGDVIGGVRRSAFQRHNIFMDILQLL